METQMALLLSKIKEQMDQQTEDITMSVTELVLKSLEEKFTVILEENKNLKDKMENMVKKIEYLENLKRKNNLIFFGVSEIGPDMSETENIKTIIENKTKIDIHKYDINNVYRLGKRGNHTRPLLVAL
ncbi:unnamed protein product [Leptidea sinapis]|uniref:Uncharacterized protein n=1 Tax=Leptidea sinapis TaxID=189913 RepID=A0A5E4QRA3_9NEOP|nr:unnamed protein product [Leptidea sinapis]